MMHDCTLATLDGGQAILEAATLENLATTFRGKIITPDSDTYDETREIWNAMIDRRPGLILQCADTDDVVAAVNLARERKLLLSVRGVGHNIAGNALTDGGLLIDLSAMKGITVNARTRTARVEPGVTLGELDAATQAHGLALPVGINSTTGIAGLTLGGGFGWLSRKHGMTIDNLVSARVVTAAGEVITASEKENADLFWGLRGGGGNFGIVAEFHFALHELGPEILSGLIVHPADQAQAVLRQWRDLTAGMPDELTVWVVMRKAPPLPFLPEEVHGTDVVVLAAMYAGDMAAGEKAMAPLRAIGTPIADVISPHPFTDWQAAFDPLLTPGMRNYWKSHDFREMTDEALDLLIDRACDVPTGHTEIFIAQMGGATNRVPADATAYRHRDANFIMNVHGRWETADEDTTCIAWCREVFDSMTPFATGGVYVNFMTEEEQQRVREAYGESWDRLVALKQRYDPENMFRLNQNIRPGAEATG